MIKRYAQTVSLKPDKIDEYKEWHENVWPEILDMLTKCNIRNYSIFLKDTQLFAYFEYIGEEYDADMEKLNAHPKTQEWEKIQSSLAEPIDSPGDSSNGWWEDMEEVFHLD